MKHSSSCSRLVFILPLVFLLLASGSATTAAAQLAEQVIDLTSLWAESNGSTPHAFTSVGESILFFAATKESGSEPWITDGTAARTFQLLDTCPGPCGAPRVLAELESGVLFLSEAATLDSNEETVLWITNGTRPGTMPLLDDTAFELHPNPVVFQGRELVVVNDWAFFAHETDELGMELWTSDGTVDGTRSVADLLPGPRSSHPRDFVQAFGNAFFFATDETGRSRLWRSDGTSAGTIDESLPGGPGLEGRGLISSNQGLFLELQTGTVPSLWHRREDASYTRLTVAEGNYPVKILFVRDELLYFIASDPEHGEEIWRTDGTGAGTQRVSDLSDERPIDLFQDTAQIAVLDEQSIYFRAQENGQSFLFWSDGTPSSTRKTLPACSGEPDCLPPTSVLGLFPFGDRVAHVVSANFENAIEILGVDGSVPAISLEDLCPQPCIPGTQPLGTREGGLYFYDDESGPGSSLWRTDGTAAGTRVVARKREIDQGRPSGPFELARTSTGWMTRFDDFILGTEPFVFEDGSPEAKLLLDINRSPDGSEPRQLVTTGDRLVFETTNADGLGFGSLWGTAGDKETTELLFPSGTTFDAEAVATDGKTAFLVGETGQPDQWSIFTSDGTPGGTREIFSGKQPINSGAVPRDFVALGGETYFLNSFDSDQGLWRTDGTPAGTGRFLPFEPASYTRLGEPKTDGESLFFLALRPAGTDLWMTRGTPGDEQLLVTFNHFFELGGSFLGVNRIGARNLFLVCDEGDLRLWSSEGTAATTRQLLDASAPCNTGFEDEWPGLVTRDGVSYFLAQAGSLGTSLWRSDGTEIGTVSLFAGTSSRDSLELALIDDVLVFTLRDSDHGLELWASDGTAAGTALLVDLFPGKRSSSPSELTVVGSEAYFVANDGAHGSELWRTDGTTAGTRLVHDIAPGPDSARPKELTLVSDKLFFSADDGLTGRELWMLPLDGSAPPCRASQEALCLKGDRFKVEARWRDFAGRTGVGHAVPLTEDTGTFWFFDEENVETILKVLDGRSNNNHFWTFYGALSNVEYFLTVTDSLTGVSRRYFNPSRTFASVGDTQSFGPLGAGSVFSPPTTEAEAAPLPLTLESLVAATGSCAPTTTRLCLQDGRFAVEASWKDFSGNTGVGTAVGLTGDTGYFWFFRDSNVETVLKVLDGRANNGNFWVFYGSLSNVDFDLTVTDTETGRVKTYLNRGRTFGSVGDTAAFLGEG